MYKIQIQFEDGLYTAYLARHHELGDTEAVIEDEIECFDIDDLMESIPEDWKEKLTNFLNN